MLCIDIGDFSSKVCLSLDDKLISIKDTYTGDPTVPTTAFVDQFRQLLLGQQAEEMFQRHPDLAHLRRAFRANLGKNAPLLNFTPEDQTSMLLRYLKDLAEEQAKSPIETVVLTVPDAFATHQQNLYARAARRAGFQGVEFLKNALATVVYYDQLPASLPTNVPALVYETGDNFEAALVWRDGRGYRCEVSTQSPAAGGAEFDRLIREDIQRQLHPSLHNLLDLKNRSQDALRLRARLRPAYRDLKSRLNTEKEATITFEIGLAGVETGKYTLTREHFERLIAQRVHQSIEHCRSLLNKARKRWGDLAQVILVGGSSSIPLLKQEWQQIVGKQRVTLLDDPLLAICKGGALYGSSRSPSAAHNGAPGALPLVDFARMLASLFLNEDDPRVVPLMTYTEAMGYFVRGRPNDERVIKGAMLRQPYGQNQLFIQVFLDSDNRPLSDQGRPYGRRLVIRQFDAELSAVFANKNLVIVE